MIAEALIDQACAALACSQAEIARRLEATPQRLYEWRTYRRRIPVPKLYRLVTLAGANMTDSVGQYEIEWQGVKARRGKGEFFVKL